MRCLYFFISSLHVSKILYFIAFINFSSYVPAAIVLPFLLINKDIPTHRL